MRYRIAFIFFNKILMPSSFDASKYKYYIGVTARFLARFTKSEPRL